MSFKVGDVVEYIDMPDEGIKVGTITGIFKYMFDGIDFNDRHGYHIDDTAITYSNGDKSDSPRHFIIGAVNKWLVGHEI